MMSLEKGDLFEITITGNCEDPTITLRRVKG